MKRVRTNPMKILFLLHQFLPRYVTGTEQYVRSLALGLRARGHDVRVLTVEPQLHLHSPDLAWLEADEFVDGIPVRRIGVHHELVLNRELLDHSNPLAGQQLLRHLSEWPPDLVHSFHLRNLGVDGLLGPKRLGIPVLVNLMDFWFLCPRYTLLTGTGELCTGPPEGGLGCVACVDSRLGQALGSVDRDLVRDLLCDAGALDHSGAAGLLVDRCRALVGRKQRLFRALEQVEAVLAPSLFLKQMFENEGFPQGAIRHLPYGVDPERLSGRRRVYPEPIELPLRLGYVGSLTRHKGLEIAIRALRSIPGDGWRLTVHGGLDADPDYSRELLERAEGDERIRFAGPFRPTELGQVLERIDLLLVPSIWYENTPFTILEAQMMGLPVAASDLGGISEVVHPGENGLLFEAGNADALATVVRQVLENPEQLRALGAGAESRTLEQNLVDLERLYHEFVSPPTGEPDPDVP